MSAEAGACIGLDLGTSGLKGVALTAAGAVAARGSAAYPTRAPARRGLRAGPRRLAAGRGAVTGQLAAAVPARRWRGIGLSGMIPTLVTVGRRRRADRARRSPGRTAGPTRAATSCASGCGGDALYRLTGQWVDGRYLLPMYAGLADADPARAAATASIASAKDYLFGWLTGELATDPEHRDRVRLL